MSYIFNLIKNGQTVAFLDYEIRLSFDKNRLVLLKDDEGILKQVHRTAITEKGYDECLGIAKARDLVEGT